MTLIWEDVFQLNDNFCGSNNHVKVYLKRKKSALKEFECFYGKFLTHIEVSKKI